MARHRLGYHTYTAKDRSHNDADLRDMLKDYARCVEQRCKPETLAYLNERIAEQRARCVEVHGTSVY